MKKNISLNSLWGLLIFLPVTLYFYFLSEYSINIPKWDDHALKAFIVEFESANGVIPKLQTFFKQHNEHRIAFDRFFTLLVFWIHGSIEYRWLMWVGNLTLIGLLFIYYKIFQKQNLPLAYFVPVPFILFQLQLWENTFWGMAAMQNFGIVFLIFAIIYLVSSKKKINFYLAFLAAFLATYTSGNGITVFPVCIVLLILQRRFKDVLTFSIFTSILVFLYFYHYKFPQNNPSMDDIGLKKTITGFFMFLGSVFDLTLNDLQNQKITVIGGLIFFIIALIITIYLIINSKLFKIRRNLNQMELFILGSFMFLIGTSIVVTVTRISYGEIGLLTSRYKIYSILLLITIYLIIVSKINLVNNNQLATAFIFISICFNFLANFINFKEVVNFRNQLISFGINWQLEEETSKKKPRSNLYVIPNLNLNNYLPILRKQIQNTPIWQDSISKVTMSNGVLIQNESFHSTNKKGDNVVFIAQSKKKTYLMPSQLRNYPLKAFLRTGKYWQNGFNVILNNNELENGVYQLGIIIKNENKIQTCYLNDSISVNNHNSKPQKTNW